MSFTRSDQRVVQLYPTRRCNLECLHCYSESGPSQRDTIPADLAASAVADAAHLGYTMLSVSGGEPLLYRGLWAVLDAARRCGMQREIVTNGVRITPSIAARLRDAVDVVAVSLDGHPDRHNRLRHHPAAFARMQRGLALLRAHGVRFRLLCSVSADSLNDLELVAGYAVGQGASALQIHPIEPMGRASALPPDASPEDTALKAYLIVERLRQLWKDRLPIDIDVSDLRPFACDADAPLSCASVIAVDDLSSVVSPLVIEPNGDAVPLRYGFPRAFAIGNLHDAPLDRLAGVWLASRARPFLALARRAIGAAARRACPFGHPYEIIANAAADVASESGIDAYGIVRRRPPVDGTERRMVAGA